MTKEVDEEMEEYVRKTRGRSMTGAEREAYDRFVIEAGQVDRTLGSNEGHVSNLRKALASYFAMQREIRPFVVDGLTMVSMFVAQIMASMDEDKSLDFVENVLNIFTREPVA